MGKKTGVFTEGQLVYAKVKGYAAWPARITKVISKYKYGVYFYGTKEIGNCKSEELDPYDEKNRARFNTDRQLKKPDYKEAVDQIELALQGKDPAPEHPVDTNDDTIKGEDLSQDASEVDPDESQLQIAEDVPKSTPVVIKKKAPMAVKKSVPLPLASLPPPPHPQAMPDEPSETKENDEKVSRSGRKIKEKKMNNDEMDPDEVFTPPRKRLKVEEVKQMKPPLNDSSVINDFCLSKMHILQDPDRKNFLTTQYELMKVVQEVKLHLGLEQADVDRSLELLKILQETIVPNLTKLMLLKYPNTVITVKKLRNYIGNVSSWNMEEVQLVEFQEKAKLIREIAEEIYSSFKLQFTDVPENVAFFDYFNEEQKQFSERYHKLDDADLFEAFNIEEMDIFANKLADNDDAQVPQLPTTIEAGIISEN